MLVYGMYISQLKQFKLWKVSAVVGSIVIDGALTCYALLLCVCDLKTAQMNMQYSFI